MRADAPFVGLALFALSGFAVAEVTKEDILFLKRTGIDEKVLRQYIETNGGAPELTYEDQQEIRAVEAATPRPAAVEPRMTASQTPAVGTEAGQPTPLVQDVAVVVQPATVVTTSTCITDGATGTTVCASTTVVQTPACQTGPVSIPALHNARNSFPYFPASEVLPHPCGCAATSAGPLPAFGAFAPPPMGSGYPGLYNTNYQPGLANRYLR